MLKRLKRLNRNSEVTMDSIRLEEVQLSSLPSYAQNLMQAKGASGRILRFKDAVLARAEKNKNGDRLTEQNLHEIAASLPLSAIDIEHDPARNIGAFIEARVSHGALLTGGYVWADRYPDEVEGIRRGEQRLSIEAIAEQAGCSVCGGWFSSRNQYCAHLKSPKTSGAERQFKNMTGTGGAITRQPAGTNTDFDPGQVALFASLKEDQGQPELEPVVAQIEIEIPVKEKAVDIRANAAKAAQALLNEFIAQFQQIAQMTVTTTPSPVESPMAYHPGNPALVEQIASKPGAPTTPTTVTPVATPTQANASETPSSETPESDPKDEVIRQLTARLEALENKLTASQETPKPEKVGVIGLSWESDKKPSATEKIRIVA